MSERMRKQREQEKETPSIRSDTLQRSPLASQQDTEEVQLIVQDVLSSSGQSLDSKTRAFMEPRFGHDFSQVRVHTDGRAVESAQAVNALAYTVGQDVVFGQEQYVPETMEGKKLVAHELTHVVQQASSPSSGEISINDPADNFEQIADGVAADVVADRRTPTPKTHAAPPFLQREVAYQEAEHTMSKPGNPQLLMTGKQTAVTVAKILPTANTIIVPSSLGDVEAEAGGHLERR